MVTRVAPPVAYTAREVCQLARVTYRQLDTWCRSGYLHPVQTRVGTSELAEGSGTIRHFSPLETVKACALSRMLTDGISLQVASYLVARGRYAVLVERPLPEATIPTFEGVSTR